ncbi:unnamed protein product, partial [Prorocentrum cordatum]
SLTSNEEQAAFVVEGAAEEDAELVANRLEFFREGRETCEALRLAAEPGREPKACREACERVSATWAQYQETSPGSWTPTWRRWWRRSSRPLGTPSARTRRTLSALCRTCTC